MSDPSRSLLFASKEMCVARRVETPLGFEALEVLPAGMLATTPSPHLIGPRKGIWDRLSGEWQVAENVHSGRIGAYLAWTFDYIRSDRVNDFEDNSTSKKRRWTVVAVDLDAKEPALRISKRSFVEKAVVKWAQPGIEVGDPEFDDNFTVSGSDEYRAAQILSPRLRSYLCREAGDFTWDLGRNWLVGWEKGRADHQELIDEATGFIDAMQATSSLDPPPPKPPPPPG